MCHTADSRTGVGTERGALIVNRDHIRSADQSKPGHVAINRVQSKKLPVVLSTTDAGVYWKIVRSLYLSTTFLIYIYINYFRERYNIVLVFKILRVYAIIRNIALLLNYAVRS